MLFRSAMYVKDCSVYNLSDNGIYFAAGSYKSDTGCHNCTVDGCSVTLVGQTGLMNIGGNNNQFINSQVENTRGAGGAVYNTNGTVTYDNCTFTMANNIETTTPWGGNTDDYSGAAFGMSVELDDETANVTVKNSSFVSGGDSVFFKNSEVGDLTSENNSITFSGFTGGLIDESSSNIDFIPEDLPLLSTVLSNMELKDGVNQITENFVIVFDLTQTYITANGVLLPNNGQNSMPTLESIKLGLTAKIGRAHV